MYPTSARFRDAVRGSHRVVANARICSAIQFGPHPTGLELVMMRRSREP